MYSNLEKWIYDAISRRGWTKKLVYDSIGVTQNGFIGMLRKETISISKFTELCILLRIDPCTYFKKVPNTTPIAEEPEIEYNKAFKVVEINDKDSLINFQQRQIDKLTDSVNTLSNIISNMNS